MSLELSDSNPQAWARSYVAGDEKAGEKLAEHVLATLERKLRRFGVSPQEADDLAQHCAVAILRRIKEYNPERGELEAWVGGFALNAVRMFRRFKAGHRPKDLPIEEFPTFGYEVGIAATRRDLLAAAVESLDVVDRELLHMKFSLKMSSADIAACSDMNPAQVRKRLSRAVEKLRQHPAVHELLTGISPPDLLPVRPGAGFRKDK